jgi:hypothetical protein
MADATTDQVAGGKPDHLPVGNGAEAHAARLSNNKTAAHIRFIKRSVSIPANEIAQ